MEKRFMTNKLIVFLRRSVPGQVKSRLAVDLGAEEAFNVYKWLLRKTEEVISKVNCEKLLYFDSPNGPTEEFFNDYTSFNQHGNDLGQRMENALKENAGKKVLIGSDCPELNESLIEEAFHGLEKYDIVLGPAEDGGVYLIGLSDFPNALFKDVDWGSHLVKDQIVRNASILNLRVMYLKQLSDLDRKEDLDKFKEQYQSYLDQYNVTKRAG